MITSEKANFIAYDWIDSWNRQDIEGVLKIYDRSICHTSPLVRVFSNSKVSTIRGRRRLRGYFSSGMKRLKGSCLEIVAILLGVDSFSIIYKTKRKKNIIEVMFLNGEGKVYRSYAYYS